VSIILNIETSSKNCSVSISKNGEIIGLEEQHFEQYSHSKSLHLFIDSLFKKTKLSPDQLSAVSVSQGPGSYTGLRIGVSAAKGICYALNIPLIAIDTLHILARKTECSEGYIISTLDARRDEIYYSIFKSSNCKITETIVKTDFISLNPDSFSNYLESSTVNFVGNCNEKIMRFLNHENIIFSDFALPSAKEMGLLSHFNFFKKKFVDISEFQPNYLKDFGGQKINS
tara:strand:+ start:329 stop:1012 length:684 start_codon:yes stop_codon:yes gene_type:complete